MMQSIIEEMQNKVIGGEILRASTNQQQEEDLMHRQSFKMKREKNLELERQRVQKQEMLQQQEKQEEQMLLVEDS